MTIPSRLNQSPELVQIQPRYSGLINQPIDNTRLKSYKCPRRYMFEHRLHRRGRGLPSPPINYGSGWHGFMQVSYKSPVCSRAELVERAEMFVAENIWQQSSNPDDYRTFKRCRAEFENYLDFYGMPWEEANGRTMGWPDEPMVELGVELQVPGARHPYTGKLDRIVDDNGQFLIEDHKTTSQMRSDTFTKWYIDNQMIGYAALGRILTGLPISGVRINLHVIRKSDSLFERQTIPFSEKRIQEWYSIYDEHLDRLERDIERYQAGDPLAFPADFTECDGKYSVCSYMPICTLDPERRLYALEQDFDVSEWNPLASEDSDA